VDHGIRSCEHGRTRRVVARKQRAEQAFPGRIGPCDVERQAVAALVSAKAQSRCVAQRDRQREFGFASPGAEAGPGRRVCDALQCARERGEVAARRMRFDFRAVGQRGEPGPRRASEGGRFLAAEAGEDAAQRLGSRGQQRARGPVRVRRRIRSAAARAQAAQPEGDGDGRGDRLHPLLIGPWIPRL
jgi:hypothetical protein